MTRRDLIAYRDEAIVLATFLGTLFALGALIGGVWGWFTYKETP